MGWLPKHRRPGTPRKPMRPAEQRAREEERRRFLETVRGAARGQWVAILRSLGPPDIGKPLDKPGSHFACPVHGGNHGDAFRFFKDVNETGGGICNTCGAQRDGFAMLQWLNGWNFKEALDAVADELGIRPGSRPWSRRTPPPPPPPSREPEWAANEARMRRVWEASVAPTHDQAAPLRQYLVRRGLLAELDPHVVRVHPELPFFEEHDLGDKPVCLGYYPTMLARFQDPAGKSVGIHRTYLTDDGHKAPFPKVKKLMPPCGVMTGGAIRLFPPGPEMGIAEGIETALAVRQRTQMPVWAAYSSSLLASWEPPEGTRLVVIWADLDRSGGGQSAAQTLRDRLLSRGIQVALHLPPGPIPDGKKGVDWCDVWRTELRRVA